MYREMPSEKQEIVNKFVPMLVNEIMTINPELGKQLKAKLEGKSTPLYLKVTSGKALKTGVYNTPQGRVFTETKGLTTTIYPAGNRTTPMFQVITLPEKLFFIKTKNGYVINRKGVIPLAHELGHAGRPNLKTLHGELESDIIAIQIAKRLRLMRESREYIAGRPTAQLLERKAMQIRMRKPSSLIEEILRAITPRVKTRSSTEMHRTRTTKSIMGR